MGSILYGNLSTSIEFDDRALTHLQIVITSKLRRGESFLFSWTDAAERGSGRNSLWINPSIPLMYRYRGNRVPVINRTWIRQLSATADSGTGLIFTPEPTEIVDTATAPQGGVVSQ
jgi:hypothetical protein